MSNLSIYDITKNQWNNNVNFLDYCKAGKYSIFNGISFVSNLKFIEKNLLPRFANINLILGLSDNGNDPIGEFLNGIMSDRANFVVAASDLAAIKDRVLNGSLNFRFTKKDDALIHSKFYLMYNDYEYQCFVGSMNLTENALNKNHEMLISFSGNTNDARFSQFLQLWENAQNWSNGYLDAKHLSGLMGKTKQETITNVYNDTINNLSQNKSDLNKKDIYLVSKENFKKLHEQGIDQDSLDYNALSAKDKIMLQQVVKLTGESGSLRQTKNLKNIGSELVQIQQVISHVLSPQDQQNASNYLRSYEQMYPSPMMIFNEQNKFITIGKDVHHQEILEANSNISKNDAAIFPTIVKEYQDSKLDGEGHQACDFLLWLFEAPWLWKIQQLYDYNQDSVKKPEDVPLRAVLIGVGKTGKSTLASQLGSRLTLNAANGAISPDAPEFKSTNGNNRYATKNMNDFVTGYLKSQGPISTLIIDDAPTEYFTKPYFIRDLKGIANKGTNDKYIGPAPTVVYSTNLHDKDNAYGLSTEGAILRRCYYLGFDSKFKKGYDGAINDLLKAANNQLYLLVQVRLKEFLIDQKITNELEKKIEDDYLYPVKVVLKQILNEYGLFNDQLAHYFAHNYDFVKDRGRINWYSLVASQTYQKLITFVNNGQTANFPKKIFDDLAGLNSRNNGANWMDTYYNYLPGDSEITSRKSDSGFNVNVKKFDKFIGSPVLEELYQRTDPVAQQVAQGKITAKVFKQMLDEEHKQELNKTKRHGLFGWLHRK